jgi:cold shock CspA family protein
MNRDNEHIIMSASGLSVEEEKQRITGKVKWFNNKAGFGFVTACEGDLKDSDVFVHYSSINVPDDQYKYLVQGEYVDFELTKSDKSEHEFHAVKISGVKGGSLMCETRRLASETHTYKPRVYKTPDSKPTSGPEVSVEVTVTDKKRKYVKREAKEKEEDGFTKVPSRKPKSATKPAK